MREYIKHYKDHEIWQDMDDGYFIAYDDNDKQIAREATMNLVKSDIDTKVRKELPNGNGNTEKKEKCSK